MSHSKHRAREVVEHSSLHRFAFTGVLDADDRHNNLKLDTGYINVMFSY